MGMGDGIALHLQSFLHPGQGQARPSFLNPLYSHCHPQPRIRSWGSWLGFVMKKDYPDQSRLISAPACTLPVVTGTLFSHRPEPRKTVWVWTMGHVSPSRSC